MEHPEQPAGADAGLEAVFGVGGFGVDGCEEVGETVGCFVARGGVGRGWGSALGCGGVFEVGLG